MCGPSSNLLQNLLQSSSCPRPHGRPVGHKDCTMFAVSDAIHATFVVVPISRAMNVQLIFAVSCVFVVGAATQPPSPLRVDGLVAATFTPFLDDRARTFNPPVIEAYVDWLNSTGVQYVYASGTTGESVKLTTAERLEQAQVYVTALRKFPSMKLIVHVGAECLADAIAMAANAEKIGADAIAAMPPSFFKPASVEALSAHMSAIAMAAPSLPFYYYHIPSMNNVIFPMYDLVLEMEKTGAPNFVGIKYTGLYQSPSFMDVAKIIGYKNNKYEVLCGRDEMMIEALAAGITGFVGSQYNYAGDLYNSIRYAWQKGDIKRARELQLAAIHLLDVALDTLPKTADGPKSVMSFVLPIGQARLPNLPVSSEEMATLKAGAQRWCNDVAHILHVQLCGRIIRRS